ncbi:hypothetical protein [Spirillospora sp. NPDC029432]|uniref:hypothetical protein n=1 Tax=Spirillospora sp. NPDC029432 TaxID=3154599 RepID=UPI003454D187
MSFELVAWPAQGPVTAEEAAALDRAALPPHPAVTAFAADLAAAAPDTGLETGGSRYAAVTMAPDRADEVATLVYGLAKANGLVCYDPGRGLVHNLAPRTAHPETQLHTGDGMVVIDPDLGLIRDVLGRLSPRNPFAALVLFGHHFVQVSPEPGGYELEYKDSAAGRLYRTRTADLADVRRAFEEYATDDRSFLDRHAWEG